MPLNERGLVIKVKYGDTLKRFGAYIHGQSMDHNMSKLRSKIIDLFKFSPDADLILTYTDEDGDIVTLDDDDELCDAAISQHLNPLRITVQLKANPFGSPDSKSLIASSTSTRSPQVGTQPAAHISSAIKQEPVQNAIPKIIHHVFKPTASAPTFTEVVENFSTLTSHCPIVDLSGKSSDISPHSVDLSAIDGSKTSMDSKPVPLFPSSANSTNTVPEHILKLCENGSTTQFVGPTAPTILNLHTPGKSGPSIMESLTSTWTGKKNVELVKEGGDAHYVENSVTALALHQSTPPADLTGEHNPCYFERPKLAVPPTKMNGMSDMLNGDGAKQFPISSAPFTSEDGFNSLGSIPTNRHIGAPTYDIPLPVDFSPNKFHNFHRGVQCDGCEMLPIAGPRFKSNVKEDYDLCRFCYIKFGSEADYTRIDQSRFEEFYNPHSRYLYPSPPALNGFGMTPWRAQLDSHFIRDVTISDGSLMGPSNRFTKIWRMRNTGTIAWPFGTQLLWLSGDKLGNQGSVRLEIPVGGCPVDEDMDIAVDFTAPSRSGKYTSYWQMASPAGQKFGKGISVSIQVTNSAPNSAARSFYADFNLNLPPESIGCGGLGNMDHDLEPLDGICSFKHNLTNTTTESVKPLADEIPRTCVGAAKVDGLFGASDGVAQPVPAVVCSASYPSNEFPVASAKASPVTVVPPFGAATDDSPLEQTLLKQLEAMGFNQIDLNKEVLRMNDYNMALSLDYLCSFAE